ncbi:ABC transporter permease [Paenibacillus faecalis]|uniref:ABC transporter permease n=1 Tax=Paenibacillus faecalis TaxID=2079532 RepID=UPI000D0E77B3|nr:FtsX-like permease family protein [Paenibacillus faecalis]
MRKLFKTAAKFLLAHKSRNVFLITGVSLGVALIVVAQILIASLEASNERAMKEQHGDFDLLVGYQTAEKSVEAEEIKAIKSLSAVEHTSLILYPYLNKETEMDMWGEPIYVGFENNDLSLEHPFVSVAEGHFPKEGEALISSFYAKQHNLKIDSSIEMRFPPNGMKEIVISGFTEDNEALSNMVIFDYGWLQQATSNEGRTTAVILQMDHYQNKSKVINQLREVNPDFFIDQREVIDKERENIGGLGPIIQGLHIAIYLVSALIMISTMRMSVQEKQKELATLRLLGFEKRHILLLVLMESLLIGLLSLVVGLVAGMLVPIAFIDWFMNKMGVQYVELVFPWSDLFLSLGIFSLVIFISSFMPAYQASLAPPIVAYRGSANVQSLSKRFSLISILVTIIGCALFLINLFLWQSRHMYIVNAILFLVCAFLSIPIIFALCNKLIALISKFYKVPIEVVLADRNLIRQLNRNVQLSVIFTIGIAISMIGIVILTTVKNDTTEIIKETHPYDFRVTSISSPESEGFSYSFYEIVETDPSIEAYYYTNVVLFDLLNQDGLSNVVFGINGTDLQSSFDAGNIMTENGLSSEDKMSKNGVVIPEKTAKKLGYELGDTIVVNVSDDSAVLDEREFVVEGVVINADHLNEDYHFYTTRKNMDKLFGIQTLYRVDMNILHDEKTETAASIQSLLQDPQYSNTILYDRAEELTALEEQFLQRVFILYFAVGLIIVFTIIGLMNSAASSIKERLKELSMLRVLGNTKKRLFSLLLLEGALLTGTVGMFAVGFSTISAYCLLESLNAATFHAMPFLLIGLVVASPMIGAGAVLYPALWATRQDVIKALQ